MEMKLSNCLRMVVLLLALFLTTAGCSDKLPVAPAQGKVLYRGEPLKFGGVMFQPEAGPPARATIQSDGTFVLSTYEEGDGAVIGTHKVRITCYESQNPDAAQVDSEKEVASGRNLIPQRYASYGTSKETREIKETNEPLVFELTD